MENYESALSLCEKWLEKRVKRLSPRSLTDISMRKIMEMIKLYPASTLEVSPPLAHSFLVLFLFTSSYVEKSGDT